MLIRPSWNLCLTSANHLLLAINASINFLIYCSIGRKFKAVLRRVFYGKDKDITRKGKVEKYCFLSFYSSRFELSSKNSSHKDHNSTAPSPSFQTVQTVAASPDVTSLAAQSPRTDTSNPDRTFLTVETKQNNPDRRVSMFQTESVCLYNSDQLLGRSVVRTRSLANRTVTKF